MSNATVINLASGEPVTLLKRDQDYCTGCGKAVLIDPKLRQITCRDCGAVIDPFNWAVKMSREEEHLLMRIEALKREADIHDKQVEAMKVEEQRIKARIRAAKESLLKSAGV